MVVWLLVFLLLCLILLNVGWLRIVNWKLVLQLKCFQWFTDIPTNQPGIQIWRWSILTWFDDVDNFIASHAEVVWSALRKRFRKMIWRGEIARLGAGVPSLMWGYIAMVALPCLSDKTIGWRHLMGFEGCSWTFPGGVSPTLSTRVARRSIINLQTCLSKRNDGETKRQNKRPSVFAACCSYWSCWQGVSPSKHH